MDKIEKDGLGPGAYLIKGGNTAPQFSFGSRFDTDIRSKDHIRPKKVDGPGPGSYTAPSSINVAKPDKKNRWGKASRDPPNSSKNFPGPGHYGHKSDIDIMQ